MDSTSNDHPHYQRTIAPNGQPVIVSRQRSKMDRTLRVVMKQIDCSIHRFHLDKTGRKLGQAVSSRSFLNDTG